MGSYNQRSNHTMPKIYLLMNEFLRRLVYIWGRVKLCSRALQLWANGLQNGRPRRNCAIKELFEGKCP